MTKAPGLNHVGGPSSEHTIRLTGLRRSPPCMGCQGSWSFNGAAQDDMRKRGQIATDLPRFGEMGPGLPADLNIFTPKQ